MKFKGDLSKMKVRSDDPVNYKLNLENAIVDMNKYLGRKIVLTYDGIIHCVECGKTIPKPYGQGFCYPCFLNSPKLRLWIQYAG